MAKRRKSAQQRTHNLAGERPGFSRREAPRPPRSGVPRSWLIVGAVGVAAVLVIGAFAFGILPPRGPSSSPSPVAIVPTVRPSFNLQPPAATPLANPPSAPAGDGTTATIQTELGNIVIDLYTESAPVASENFINLANAGFYNGVVFHRIVPDFMIQGGDPEGTGGGGPDYTIQDEPIVGQYTRGTVAMARTSAPNSQGSQFFIIVEDSPFLAGGGYTIFGTVESGMDVVDQIVAMPSANDEPSGQGGTALDPVAMQSVTIQTP